MSVPTRRRAPFAAALTVTASMVLAACGDDGASSATSASSPAAVDTTSTAPATSAAPATFPLVVEHQLGGVTIEDEPQRVVAMTSRDADTLLALGVTPVAIHSRYGFESGVGPWATDKLGDATPTVWTGPDFNYEAVAATEPDLIVYTASGGEQDVYDSLSAIAPTIDLPLGAVPYGATTEQSTMLIAGALGRTAQGERILDDLDQYYADQAAQHPIFDARTVNYLDVYPGGISSYSREHIVNEIMYEVGFDPIAASELTEANGSVQVSAENVAEFDADIVLVYPFGRTLEEIVEEAPTIATLDSYADDRMFVLQDLALSNSSVLSIPYALDDLLPKMDAALANGE